jgi:DNA-binding transcriptional LysR family regulator
VPSVEQVLTVGATAEFGSSILVRKLRPLLDSMPQLRLHFRFSDDLVPLLLQDEVDVAVDCRPHTDPSVQATGLFREKYVLVASPSFLRRHPVRRLMDLEQVPVLSLDRTGNWWANALRACPGQQRPVMAHLVEVDQVRGMVHAALEGYGIALLPKYAVLGKIARDELRAVLPGLRLLEDRFCLYQKRRHATRDKNRLITEYLLRLDTREFGDAIRGVGRARVRPGSASS